MSGKRGPRAGSSEGSTRRQALKTCVAAAAVSFGWPEHGAARSRPGPDDGVDRDGEAALNHALELIHAAEVRGGLSTHAPMAAEALCTLGHPDRAVARAELHDRLSRGAIQPATRPIDREHWRAALGPKKDAPTWDASLPRYMDWREFFHAELAESRWQDVLDTWVARLAPGLCAAATHGIIRTSHAVRGLARRENAVRLAELERGLAYWAAAYEELPVREFRGERAASYAEALERVPLYWRKTGREPEGRNIVEGLRHVPELEDFADVRDLVTHPEDVGTALTAMSTTFAGVYLRHGTRNNPIAFVHAVTGPCALRRIAPHVQAETARAALPYAWQAAAAIYAAWARDENEPRAAEPELARAEIVARAVENGDDHAVKLTETLLCEHALAADPVFLAAAEDAVERL